MTCSDPPEESCSDAGRPVHGGDECDLYGDDPWCTHCGGEPDMQECDDPLQCCEPRCDGTWHPCTACNGTGLAKHQWLW